VVRKSAYGCCVCGEPPVTAQIIADGAVVWHCPNHLEGEARELYRELRNEGWEAPPPKTIH
jgi:hypothetical protein